MQPFRERAQNRAVPPAAPRDKTAPLCARRIDDACVRALRTLSRDRQRARDGGRRGGGGGGRRRRSKTTSVPHHHGRSPQNRTMHYLFGITEAGAISRVRRSAACARARVGGDFRPARIDLGSGSMSRNAFAIAKRTFLGKREQRNSLCAPIIVRSLNHEAYPRRGYHNPA